MQTSILRATCLGLIAVATASAPDAGAATLSFHVNLNTALLTGNTAAPFAVDFQLGAGNGLANTVTLSGFTFQGGSATGSGVTMGNATGDLTNGVTLMDLSTINEYYQTYTTGVTSIGFNVTTTLNPSAGVPDLFTVSILDKQLNPIQTNSPGVGTSAETDYLVGLPVDDHTAFSSVQTYSSNVAGSTTPGVIATALPGAGTRLVGGSRAGGRWIGRLEGHAPRRQSELKILR